MIRRNGTSAAGPTWLLIGQQAHARLAAALAADWAADPAFGQGTLSSSLTAAISAHDDGWPEWDQQPEIDPQRGAPYDFTEMPVADALAIWRRSIGFAGALGPAAAWITSAHFSALLERYRGWERASPASVELARRFLAEQELARDAQAARAAAEGVSDDELTGRQRWLQLFDALSLWFCCREPEAPLRVDPPGQPPVEFSPTASGEVACAPWPFRSREVAYSVIAREVPARRYTDASNLAGAPSIARELRWKLIAPTGA